MTNLKEQQIEKFNKAVSAVKMSSLSSNFEAFNGSDIRSACSSLSCKRSGLMTDGFYFYKIDPEVFDLLGVAYMYHPAKGTVRFARVV